MRLPAPDRARTVAGVLLATAVLLLAGDFALVQASSSEAKVLPFTVTTGNATAIGMRVTNADQGDTIEAFELLATAACGFVYRPFLRANETVEDLRNLTDEELAARAESSVVTGNLTFYVLESVHTADLLRGADVPTYREEERDFHTAPTVALERNNPWDPDPAPTNDVKVQRIVYQIQVSDCFSRWMLRVDRLDDPGTRSRFAFSSDEPWVSFLPVSQGVDFLYVARATDNDNSTYTLLQENLIASMQGWLVMMRGSTVFDPGAATPDLALRSGFILTFAAAAVLLALSMRRARAEALQPMEAAFAVASAGERHLVNLRRALVLIGALLVPLLGAATYAAWSGQAHPPWEHWTMQFFVAVHLLDVAVLALWALTLLRVHRDLIAWRKAWTQFDRTSLDDL